MFKITNLKTTAAALIATGAGISMMSNAQAFGPEDLGVNLGGGVKLCFTTSCAVDAQKKPEVRRKSRTEDHRDQTATDDGRDGRVVDHRTGTQGERTTVRDHRTGTTTTVIDHRNRTRDGRPVTTVTVENRYSCRHGYETLVKLGYSSVDPFDCEGRQYQYSAIRKTVLYRAKMSGITGKLDIEPIGFAH